MDKVLALIAHDSKKEDLVQLVKAHKKELAEIDLIATQETGQLVQARSGIPVTLLQSETNGGDLQIAALVANSEINAVIFWCDPLKAQLHEPDILALLRICNINNVPLATNLGTAEALIHLISDFPEAMSGHHVAAQYLEDIAAIHD
jgi:methylglyoxal synthase